MRRELEWNWEHMPLSKSMVHAFEQCPYRFFLQFIEKVPVEKTPEMAEGNTLHAALENLYKVVDKTQIKTAAELTEAYIKHVPFCKQMTNFVKLEQQRFEKLKLKPEAFWPKLTEEFLVDRKIWYFGTLDRFDVNEKGHGVVIDYKMGKYHKWLDSKYRFELMGYKHLLMTNKDELASRGIVFKDVKYGVLIFLGQEEGPLVWEQEIKAATERSFYKKLPYIREMITLYNDEGEWPKKMTPLCSWCPFAGKPCVLSEQVGGKDGDDDRSGCS